MLRKDERKRMKNADGQGAGRCAGGAPGGSAALLGVRLAGECFVKQQFFWLIDMDNILMDLSEITG